ncbi:MAG TPA: hypothetical protein VN277_09175 [Acidiferrobacterales bacterium]|nr:hypothetical protein [Acidiferrobacterales bacterium]
MESKQCAGCGKAFHPRPQTPKQTYCSSPQCQRERRRRWQQARRRIDPEYRDNQSRAQESWAERHRDYWRQYRQTHPQYSERNRVLQRERDARRRERVLAKMDVSARDSPVASGTYRLSPVTRDDLAKMDAWVVRITVVSKQYAPTG